MIENCPNTSLVELSLVTPVIQDLINIFFFSLASSYIHYNWSDLGKRFKKCPRLILVGVIVALGILAYFGTARGVLFDYSQYPVVVSTKIPNQLNDDQVIVGFRNTVVLVAGLLGGIPVGASVGLVAGISRFSLGNAAAESSCGISIVLGLLAGSVKRYKPQWIDNPYIMFFLVFLATIIQRFDTFWIMPWSDALKVQYGVFLPTLFINLAGCGLFLFVKGIYQKWVDVFHLEIKLLESELEKQKSDLALAKANEKALQAERERDQYEISKLMAQVKPHFFKNSLAAICEIAQKNDLQTTVYCLEKLSGFYGHTDTLIDKPTIELREELEQLRRYWFFAPLGTQFEITLDATAVPENLQHYQVPPSCLVSLAENAFEHGFRSSICGKSGFMLKVSAYETGDQLHIKVCDNGEGVEPERLKQLGKKPVEAPQKKGGNALYRLAETLKRLHAGNANLEFDHNRPQGFCVIITLPKTNQPK